MAASVQLDTVLEFDGFALPKNWERFSPAFCGVGGAKWGAATAAMAGEISPKNSRIEPLNHQAPATGFA